MQILGMIILTFLGTLAFADQRSDMDLAQSCRVERLNKSLVKLGLDQSQIEIMRYEDSCERVNFCFSFTAKKSGSVGDYSYPIGANIHFCERQGVRSITLPEGRFASIGKASCAGVWFKASSLQSSYCVLGKPFELNEVLSKDFEKLSLLSNCGLYFNKGKITHFVINGLSAEEEKRLKLKNSKFYSIVDGNIAEKKNTDIVTFDSERRPEPEELSLILKKYSYKQEDFKDLTSASGCGEDYDISKKTFNLITKNKMMTKDFVLPPDSRFIFCDSDLTEINFEATDESHFLGHKCDGIIKVLQNNKQYECELSSKTKFQGVELPEGVRIFFSRKGIDSFGIGIEKENLKIKGIKLIPNTLYTVKDGKPAIKYGQ